MNTGSRLAIPDAWLDELGTFLRVPSVSAEIAHTEAVRRAAEWVRDFVTSFGGECALVEGARHPLVVGHMSAQAGVSGVPTVVIYGHFDVQPPGEESEWDSDPFEPEIRDGWLYARGAADDKGNFFMLLKATELLARAGALPVNVVVVADGEEESGGNTVSEYLSRERVRADAAIIFDGPLPRMDLPAFKLGTRGLLYLHVEARTSSADGFGYGPSACWRSSAADALVEILGGLSSITDDLRAGVEPALAEEWEAWRELPEGPIALRERGVRAVSDVAAEEFYERTLVQPSLDLNGISAGSYEREGLAAPTEASANISLRLAGGQDVDTIRELCLSRLMAAVPPGVEVKIDVRAAVPAALTSARHPAIQLAAQAFHEVLGRRPLMLRSGGTLPVRVGLEANKIPTVHTGFDVPEGNVHAPNERLLLRYLPLGVAAAQQTLISFASLPAASSGAETP